MILCSGPCRSNPGHQPPHSQDKSEFRFLGFFLVRKRLSPALFRTYTQLKLSSSDWIDPCTLSSLSGLYQSLQSGRSLRGIRVPSCSLSSHEERKTWIRFLPLFAGAPAVAIPPPELGLRSGVWGYAVASSFFCLANKVSTSGGNCTQASFRSLYSSAVTYWAISFRSIFPRWITPSLVNLSNPS